MWGRKPKQLFYWVSPWALPGYLKQYNRGSMALWVHVVQNQTRHREGVPDIFARSGHMDRETWVGAGGLQRRPLAKVTRQKVAKLLS